MKNIKLLLIAVVCTCFAIDAQNVNVDASGKIISIKAAGGNSDIEGSEYINDKFTPIVISQFKGKIYNGRFNAFNGDMEVKVEDDKVIALDTAADYEIKFSITNKIYRTESFTDDDGTAKKGFLVVISDANTVSLLKEESIKFTKKISAASSYERDIPARYIRDNDNYYIKYNGTVTYISQKKKDLLNAFPNEADKLNSYIKKNKINLKQEEDLIKVVSFLSSIPQ